MQSEVARVVAALNAIRVPAILEEYDIHAAVAEALRSAGIEFTHEAKLGPGRRIDFLCGVIGIEVKKSRPQASRLTAQISGYLKSEMLDCVIVVLQKPCALPAEIHGKRVYTVSLNRLWGVALP